MLGRIPSTLWRLYVHLVCSLFNHSPARTGLPFRLATRFGLKRSALHVAPKLQPSSHGIHPLKWMPLCCRWCLIGNEGAALPAARERRPEGCQACDHFLGHSAYAYANEDLASLIHETIATFAMKQWITHVTRRHEVK